ncbi:MAG: hypothetical protein QM619_04685 [Micropruina sp.]|uniref:hypothetical protein n=1 Tax=Micropruina sp. TaxID=2737536 RepID=UPI0039E2B4FB
MRPNWPRIALVLVAIAALVGGLVWGGAVVWSNATKQPLPMDDQCRATADGATVTLTPEQAVNATLIASVALSRDLPARAVTIALATAYQESGIRNLDYGHADSIGLFQQRPSKGWGTVKQIMDPFYSSGKFYDALVRVKNWRTSDINDVAQAVQRSGYPDAYRKHVDKAQVLSSVLAGATAAGFSCTVDSPDKADAADLTALIAKALKSRVEVRISGSTVIVQASSERIAWAVASLAIAHTEAYGVTRVSVGAADWVHDPHTVASWTGIGGGRNVTIAVKS